MQAGTRMHVIAVLALMTAINERYLILVHCFLKGINCTAYLLSVALIKVTDVITSVSCTIVAYNNRL